MPKNKNKKKVKKTRRSKTSTKSSRSHRQQPKKKKEDEGEPDATKEKIVEDTTKQEQAEEQPVRSGEWVASLSQAEIAARYPQGAE